MPRLTVVIPAYNAERFIGECLDSVYAQTFRDFEVVVADDGSTDSTADLAASRQGTVVLERTNGGPAAARNAAAAAGTGELIAFLDADDLWSPTKLERQVAGFDARPERVLSATVSRCLGRDEPTARIPPVGWATAALIRDNTVTTSSVVVRRETFERAGGFDTDPELISVEDYDLWLALSLLGPFAGHAEPLVERRWHGANLSADPLRLDLRTLSVLEKFERRPESASHVEAVSRRKAELAYRVGRTHLSRGERLEGRRALRRSRVLGPGSTARSLALEPLSWLPRGWLLALHEIRQSRRGRDG